MKLKKEFFQALDEAERVKETVPQLAKELPGMLGRVVPAMLERRGWYAAKIDGVKTLYVLSAGYAMTKGAK